MPIMFLFLNSITETFYGCNAMFPAPGKHKESRVWQIIYLNNVTSNVTGDTLHAKYSSYSPVCVQHSSSA